MQSKKLNVFIYIAFILMVAVIVFPILGVVMVSLSNEQDIQDFGYRFIPLHFDLSAYRVLLAEPMPLLRAIGVSLYACFANSTLALLLNAAIGYALSRKMFRYRKIVLWYLLIPMMFSGGLIPSYIINTQLLGLRDSLAVYAVLGLVNGGTIIMLRTFFSQIPNSLVESAQISGASELQIFVHIIAPMSKTIMSTIFSLSVLSTWNGFEISLYYISNERYYNLQYFLQNILRQTSFINQIYKDNPLFAGETLPEQTLQYALAVLACLPVLLVFPYMQKFFSKGLAVGSVKE